MYYVYILTNKTHTVLYTGVTGNIERRMYEHKNKLIEGFTKRYNADKLVFFEAFNNVNDALVAEKKIKGWKKAVKYAFDWAKDE
jgi:putative endonuclease